MKKERESVEREEVINRISAYLYSAASVHVCVCVCVCVCEGVRVLPEDRVTDSSITFANVSSSPGISSLWTPSALCVLVHIVLYTCVYVYKYIHV